MKTIKTIQDIEETTAGNITPEYYFEWGDEPTGCVSTGLYLDDTWYSTGVIKKDEALKACLKYHCPFN